MKLEDVRQSVAAIATSARDSSSGAPHKAEDSLYTDVLRAIAAGATNAAELAGAALMTKEIDFDRWYT